MSRYTKPYYFRSLYLLPYASLAIFLPILFHHMMAVVGELGNLPTKPFGGIPLWIVGAAYAWAAYALWISGWRFYKDHVLGEYYADVLMRQDRYRGF